VQFKLGLDVIAMYINGLRAEVQGAEVSSQICAGRWFARPPLDGSSALQSVFRLTSGYDTVASADSRFRNA